MFEVERQRARLNFPIMKTKTNNMVTHPKMHTYASCKHEEQILKQQRE